MLRGTGGGLCNLPKVSENRAETGGERGNLWEMIVFYTGRAIMGI